MIKIENLFFGITTKPFRNYLAIVFREKANIRPRLVLPCAGLLTDAKVGIVSGYKPENIYASDISLFSSVIGCVLEGRPVTDLGIKFHGHLSHLNQKLDTELAAATVLYGLKLCQLKDNNYHLKTIKEEVEKNSEKYIQMLNEGLNRLVAPIKGVHYKIKDMWEEIEENVDREDTLIFLGLPVNSAKDYPQMFDTKGLISWNEPRIASFDPKTDYPRLYRLVDNRPALVLIYKVGMVEREFSQNLVFAAEMKKATGKFGYILANRPDECKKFVFFQNKTPIRPSKYPLIPEDHLITPESKVSFVKVDHATAMYYRMLLCHRFGTTGADQYYLAILDGYMWGICGFMLRDAYVGRNPVVYENFGFTVPLKNYKHPHKLFNMLLVTQEFRDILVASNPKLAIAEIEKFQTTCLTKYPALSHQRGITKLRERKKMPDGTFKLIYESEFKPMTFKDCILAWLQKEKQNG